MKMKKIFSLLMAVILTASLAAGCKKQDGAEGKKDGGVSAKGRYVEQEIDLPKEAGEAIGILDLEDGVTFYARTEEGYYSYVLRNGTWTDPEEVSFMTDARERLGLSAEFVYSGEDGAVYAIAYPERDDIAYGQHIIKDAGDGSALDCTPASCLEADESGFTEMIVDLAVFEDGTMALADMGGLVKFYQDGKKIGELPKSLPYVASDHKPVMAVSGGRMAIFGEDRHSIDFYTLDNLEKTDSIDMKQELVEAIIVPGEEGIWYVVDKKGIRRITEQGSIVETIMDGTGALMSTDSAYLINFLHYEGDEFYGLYGIAKGAARLMHYRYDKDVKAVPDETLSIYGVSENQTISQAVYTFQSKHPDVRVDYHTAAGNEEIPLSETIRTLNAELLNGSGADILILDGLPIDSYIEKGILSDISKLGDRLSENGVLMDVIGNTASRDGKIYAVPARIGVPIIFGDEAKAEACKDPDTFHTYLEQNPGERLFGTTTHDLAGMTLLNSFYGDLMKEQGGFSEEKLKRFLDDWMKLCEIQNTRGIEAEMELPTSAWERRNTEFSSGMGLKNDPVMIEEIDGLISSIVPYTIARDKKETPESLNQYYVPQVIAGINASSKQQELAEEFIECLFDEGVQKMDCSDGFPVLKSALAYQAEYVETPEAMNLSYSIGSQNPETGEEVQFGAAYPPKDEVNQLIRIIEELSVPFMMDGMIRDTLLTEMENCYNGKQSTEETAKAICRKVDTYLSE